VCALLTFLHLLLPFDSIARCVYLLLQRKKASKHKQNRTRVSVYVCILKIREYLKRCTIVVNTRKGVQKKVTPTSSWLCFPSFCICVCDCVCCYFYWRRLKEHVAHTQKHTAELKSRALPYRALSVKPSSVERRIVERNACRAESTIRHQCKNSTKAMMKKSETIYFWGVVHTHTHTHTHTHAHINIYGERCKTTHTTAEAAAAASTGTRRQPDRQNAH